MTIARTDRTVLVLGEYRQTIVVVRSLDRAGYRITLGTADPRGPTALSRHVAGLWRYTPDDDERFHAQLEAYLTLVKPGLVFVVGETPLRSLARTSPRFDGLSRWAAPAWQTIMTCFDKHAMNCLAVDLGIPTPRWILSPDDEPLTKPAAALGYPIVIKRRDSSAQICNKKALIFDTAAGFEAFLPHLGKEPDRASLMVQQFAPGARHNCHFGAVAGKLVCYFQQKVIRTDEPDDTGIGIEGISVPPSPLLRMYCTRLIDALRYNGIGCIQFLVDEASGNVAFLELNARMDSTAALPYRIGYDFPKLAVDIAEQGEAVALRPSLPPYRIGARYHWLYGDAVSWLEAWRRGEARRTLLARLARSALTATTSHHLTWEPRDPLPTLHQYARLVNHFVARRFSVAGHSSERTRQE